jgi:hypothetical protein
VRALSINVPAETDGKKEALYTIVDDPGAFRTKGLVFRV